MKIGGFGSKFGTLYKNY